MAKDPKTQFPFNKPLAVLAKKLQDAEKKKDKEAPKDFKPRYNRKKTGYA